MSLFSLKQHTTALSHRITFNSSSCQTYILDTDPRNILHQNSAFYDVLISCGWTARPKNALFDREAAAPRYCTEHARTRISTGRMTRSYVRRGSIISPESGLGLVGGCCSCCGSWSRPTSTGCLRTFLPVNDAQYAVNRNYHAGKITCM